MKNFILKKIKDYSTDVNRIAIKYENQVLTYKELDIKSEVLANKIRKKIGNKANCPIVIYQKRGLEFIECIIAIMKCGCYYVPVENTIPIERVKYIYNDVQAELIISDDLIIESNQYKVLNIGSEQLVYKEKKFLDIPELQENDLVYVMYTSGTSGKPKGVKIKYSNLQNLVESFWNILYYNISESVNVGVLASFGFDSSVKQIYCSLFYGHTLVISEDDVKYFGRKIHEFLNNNNISVCDCTPSHIKLMTKQRAKQDSNVQYLVVGGENLRWETLSDFKKSMNTFPVIINVYGPTECCVDVSYNIIHKFTEEQKGYVPIGIPLNNTKLSIHDENLREITRSNCEGELFISGKQVGAGYVNLNSSNFISLAGENNEFDTYRTGDLAMYNDNMDIIILGRIDRQVKLNGFRIELDEISSIISEHAGCECAVCMFENKEIKKLVAFLTKRFDEAVLKECLSKQLPKYMIPKAFIFIEMIPLTTSGKLNISMLEQIYLNMIM